MQRFRTFLTSRPAIYSAAAIALLVLCQIDPALAATASLAGFGLGVVNVKATNVNNCDLETVSGKPNKMNPLLISRGYIRDVVGLVAKAAGDSNNSVYRFARVRSSDRIKSVVVEAMDAIAGLTAIDIGVYDIAANGGAVVSQALFATALDLHLGLTAPVNYRYAVLTAAGAEKALWQLLGLASDPGKEYDIAFTATTAGGAAGNIAGAVTVVSPDA